MSGFRRFKFLLSRELVSLERLKSRMVIFATLAGILLLVGWLIFDGPCRVSVFFRIPGNGFTVFMYYALWLIMFPIGGCECAVYMSRSYYCHNNILLRHIAVYLCMFVWYPLFFTLFSQFLAFVVIAAAAVLSIINFCEIFRESLLFGIVSGARMTILLVYLCVNLAFLLIN